MSDTLKAGAVALATTEGTKSWSYFDIDVSLNSTPSFGTLMSHFVNLGIDTRDARRLNTPTKILELANSGYSLWVNGAMYYFTKLDGTMDGDTTWGGGAYYTNFDIFNIFFGIWNADGTDYIVPFAFYKYQGSNSGGLEPFRWSPLPFTFLNGDLPSADIIGTGGGATHIAKVTGALSALSGNLSDILIVAGGGGGGLVADRTPTAGANGGGISGSGNNSGNQSTGYAFGQGEASGGGGGLYGGYKAANGDSGGAGSGYIGNLLLDAKKMIGFNVPTSDVESTKTESVNVYSATAEENKPKAGNGFARITWLRDLPPIPPEWDFGEFYENEFTDKAWVNATYEANYNSYIETYDPVVFSDAFTAWTNSPAQIVMPLNTLPDKLYILRGQNYEYFRFVNSDHTELTQNINMCDQNTFGVLAYYLLENPSSHKMLFYVPGNHTLTFKYSIQNTPTVFDTAVDLVEYLINNYCFFDDTYHDTAVLVGWFPFVKNVYLVDDLTTLSNPQELYPPT